MTGASRSGPALVVGLLLALSAALALSASEVSATPGASSRRSRHAAITEQLDCSACHTPDGWRSLVQGEVGAGFDHSRTGFPLTGRHAGAGCIDCHAEGRTITRECKGCHQDAHGARLSPDCSRCHDAVAWQRTSAIERHRLTRLPLTGMHALADCTDCHRRTTARSFAPVPANCFACHASDYRRSDVHPVHVGSADGSDAPLSRDCARCHRASGWSPAVIAASAFSQALRIAPPRDHDLRFPIRFGPHRGADCGDCHASPDGRGALRCLGCHAHDDGNLRALHGGKAVPSQASACLACHPGGTAR